MAGGKMETNSGNSTETGNWKLETDTGKLLPSAVKLRLSPIQRKVYMLMSSEDKKYYGLEIAKKLNLKKSAVYNAIKRLCELRLLEEESDTYPRSYVLTREGRTQVSSVLEGYDESAGIFDRSHAWKFLVNVQKFPEVMPDGWKEWDVKNWSPSKKMFVVDDVEVEVRKNAERSLTIQFREIPGKDANVTEDRAYYIAYKALDAIKEDVKGIKLGHAELLNVCLTGAHHTQTNDPHSKKCLDSKVSYVGRFHSVDASTGLPETEFDRATGWQNRLNCVKYGQFIDGYVAGEVSPEATQMAVEELGPFIRDELKPILEEQVRVGKMHSDNIVKHMAVLDDMALTLREMRDAMSILKWPFRMFKK